MTDHQERRNAILPAMTRRLGPWGALIVVLFLAASCSSDDGDHDDVERRQDEMTEAVDGVVHDVAAATGIEFRSANRWAVICGNAIDPVGVKQRAALHFGPPPESTIEQAVSDAATALEDAGWSAELPANPAIVVGENDGLTLRFHFGGAGTEVSLRSSCVETSGDVANEYQDEGSTDVEWR